MQTSIELAPQADENKLVLSNEAVAFVGELQRLFGKTITELLERRARRQELLDLGEDVFDFMPDTQHIRDGSWTCAETPPDIRDRRVEITGPVDKKMIINALNSGAKVFMADFEDATTPTWSNVIDGQRNLHDAVRRTLTLDTPDKKYRIGAQGKPDPAVLFVRPRGLHLPEKHFVVDGEPARGSLVDFGLFFFHNARELLARGTGPYFYLPKLESRLEARLWNVVFLHAERSLGVPQGSIKATVLIETLPAAFEMDEILYELRSHASGLNAGRWDYLFSTIKTLRNRSDLVLPDRAQLTMTVPFMRAYTELLVATCHRRGAHAMGGMAAFVPNRKEPAVTEVALAKVREDKQREAGDGFDGTWVAHPDLVPVAMEVFQKALGTRPHQKERLREDVRADAARLVDTRVPGGQVTEAGFRNNVSVGLQYLSSWLSGNGAAAIYNLMEDVATAEIARSQLWQWIHNGAKFPDGTPVTLDSYRTERDAEMARLSGPGAPRLPCRAATTQGRGGRRSGCRANRAP